MAPRNPKYRDEYEKCFDFLQNFESIAGNYHDQLQNIANRESCVLRIRVDDIIDYKEDKEFVNNIERNTKRYISHFMNAADKLMPERNDGDNTGEDVFDHLRQQYEQLNQLNNIDNGGENDENNNNNGENINPNTLVEQIPADYYRRYEVQIIPSVSDESCKLREIKAQHVGHLVKVKGMVTRCTDVKPLLRVCVYTCDSCGAEMFQKVTSDTFMPKVACESQRCKTDRKTGNVHMQSRGCRFIKFQEVRLQELPDQVPVGHIPRCMTVRCRGEQTRKCSPGDIVTVSGIYLMDRKLVYQGPRARTTVNVYIEATQLEKSKQGYDDLIQNKKLNDEVEKVTQGVSPYDQLANSIAPEIFGHDDVKKALLLQLVGGVTRCLSDGMKIRGDLNLLLMGDPGVAKSQLLKYIATVAPRGVYTTGKGSSGVGLTAALIKDSLTGELTLEGGALVMADKGICCIDEFDKMDENDRTAIHEVMEQQTISIAKAGITTTLNARAAVLAAANPLYGRYNKRRSISENIDLPNSLLSRFDLLYLILDKADVEADRALSMHVLHVHKYLKNPDPTFEPLSPQVVKQYIAVARQHEPVVPQELTQYIVEQYVLLRAQDNSSSASRNQYSQNNGQNDQTAMTARQLLSILRLSQALARVRLHDSITEEDVDEAIRLTNSSKSSLEDGPTGPQEEDAISAIFGCLRDYVNQRNINQVSFNQAESMTVARGFSVDQLRNVLAEYEALGVLKLEVDEGSTANETIVFLNSE